MYYVDDVVTTKDLISINNTQKNWALSDFVHYYATIGDPVYIRIEELCKKYKEFPLRAVFTALAGKIVKERNIKSGNLWFSDDDFKNGEAALEFIKDIKDNVKVKITSVGTFFCLLLKTYYLNDIDRDRLRHSIIVRYGTENYGTALQCAMAIEHWYNFKSKTYRYISNEIIPRR